jgi:DNA polymerase-3 subunit beta
MKMKFTIQKNEIVSVLAKIQGLAGRRSSLAITECIRMTISESGLQIIATDLETGYEGNFPVEGETPGTIAISARKFYEIVREFPESKILIQESENRRVDIGNKNVQYHIKGMNPEDFPTTPTLEDVNYFTVDAVALKRMIDKTIVVSGIGEDKKPHINGVYFERLTDRKPTVIRMVSTDGSRLSKFDFELPDDASVPEGPGVLIPKKGLNEVSKFLPDSGTVKAAVHESYFVVAGSQETIYIRMLEGQFPQYEDIILREDGHQIVVDKERFHHMVKRMSILCNDSYRAALFTFDADELIINATNPDIGESKEDMPIAYKGGKIQAAFNPKFFIDTMNSIEDKEIIINLKSEERPCLIEGKEDKSYLSAIMPMRV